MSTRMKGQEKEVGWVRGVVLDVEGGLRGAGGLL